MQSCRESPLTVYGFETGLIGIGTGEQLGNRRESPLTVYGFETLIFLGIPFPFIWIVANPLLPFTVLKLEYVLSRSKHHSNIASRESPLTVYGFETQNRHCR